MAHAWKKGTQALADFSAPGGSRKKLVWRCTVCGTMLQRGTRGMNAIPPNDSQYIVRESGLIDTTSRAVRGLSCDEYVAFQVMES